MKTRERKKIIFGMILIILLIMIYIIYNIYLNQIISYASNSKIEEEIVKISKAEKIKIENILEKNYKQEKEEIITEQIELEYITEYRNNKEIAKGEIKVVQEGRTGIQQVTKKITYNEKNERQEEQISSITIKSAVNKIVEIGTSRKAYVSKITKGSKIYVTSDRADIMKQNSQESQKMTTISKDREMTVIETKDNWYKIVIDGQVGWIKSENVTSKNPNPATEPSTNIEIAKCSYSMELNKPSGLTLDQFKKVLTDSKDKNNIFSENAEYFYYIESQYNINGIFVASIGIHESAWGTSKISKNKKNLFGYGAYDSSPYSSSYSFSSYAEGIDLIARVLVKYYLNPKGTAIYGGETANGKYYNGNTLSGVNKKYATDKEWSNKVYKYMEYLYSKI